MKHPFLILLPLLLALSCREPASTETFVRGTGPYEYAVDFSDSTATWDVSLYSRVDAVDAPAEMTLELSWKAPSEAVFTETVYLPLSAGTSFFSRESCVPYRTAVAPAERGLWQLTIAVPDAPEGLRGMGLVVRRVTD